MSGFEIKTKWIADEDATHKELAATLARIQIMLDKNNITEYKLNNMREPAIQVPAYYLAEWIAENWWVALFEPRKDEESDDSEFIARHSLLAAQHGFALPALSIMPCGKSIHLSSAPRRAPYADVQFLRGASVDVARDDVQKILSKFVDDTINRLHTRGVTGSSLASIWEEIKALSPEEREFCELVGSLGLSPSEASDALCNSLERIYEILGSRATRDLCLAATREYIEASVRGAASIAEYLPNSQETKLAPLMDVYLPPENYARPSWLRGMQAANNLRAKYHIDIKDPRGADKIFDRLNIDTSYGVHLPDVGDVTKLPFSGAIDRDDSIAKIALLQDGELHRRFGAGRVVYLAWVSENQSRRLATNALTRDQQGSRSFAAEILIPQAYLKRLADESSGLDYDQIREVARTRRVMPDVAAKQAINAHIRVSSIPY